ncbi:MAG TPA: efflux RND transporter periplasmic adaptor subunit [Opitutaceae bacterium]|nr:efflux RND transporter periplasmic adaptor subunit [Opitutaceae bacterium]
MKRILPVLLLAAIAVGAWFSLRPHSIGDAEEVRPVARVQVAALRVERVVDSLPAFGVVEPSPSGAHTVALAYDAVVRNVSVSAGATVAAGDVVMEVDATPDAKLALNSARGAAKLADRGLEAARQRYELRLATSQDLLAAELAAEDARLRLGSLEGRGQAGDGRLVAPVAGIVTKLDLQPGAVVPAGTPLVTIAAIGQLEAHLEVEAADAGSVRAGQAVAVVPSDRPGADGASGAVRLVGANVDPVTGAVDVRVTLPAGSPWFAGEHVHGAVHVREKTALVAPRACVLPEGDRQVLYTVKDGKAVKHAVETGTAAGDAVEVIAHDLHAGDMAVTVGNYELEDGMAVQVSPSGSKGDGGKADDEKSNPERTP